MNLHKIMKKLSNKRKIFHSEADFQFALAWEIKLEYPNAKIRLEYCPKEFPNIHLDIVVFMDDKVYPIELKYKSRKVNIDIDSEHFNLKNHGAQDSGRYDFWIDVNRIETIKEKDIEILKGFVIILTNDSSYWKNIVRDTVCDAFRIHQNNIISGVLVWHGTPSAGTVKNRENAINIYGKYICDWFEYSKVLDNNYGEFRYLLLEI